MKRSHAKPTKKLTKAQRLSRRERLPVRADADIVQGILKPQATSKPTPGGVASKALSRSPHIIPPVSPTQRQHQAQTDQGRLVPTGPVWAWDHGSGSKTPPWDGPEPYLTRMVSKSQRIRLAVLNTIWATALFVFVSWLLEHNHWQHSWGIIFNSAVILFDIGLLSSYFLFFLWRMREPNPELPLPWLRVAIIATKAPSEPW